MDRRDFFIGCAITGLTSNMHEDATSAEVAMVAIEIADAAIGQLTPAPVDLVPTEAPGTSTKTIRFDEP